MTILYDLSSTQPIHKNDFHGGGEYAKVIFYKLCERLSLNVRLEVFYNPDKNIDTFLIEVCKKNSIYIHYCRNKVQISELLYKNDYAVFYSALPYSYYDLRIPPKTKFIYTIHGLRALECPDDIYYFKYKKLNIKQICKIYIKKIIKYGGVIIAKNNFMALFSRTQNQIIITISLHSKYAINYFFPDINLSNIRVLYSPLKMTNESYANETEILTRYLLISKKYILIIGGDRYEKGAYRACKALYDLFSQKKYSFLENFKVIILGVAYKKPYQNLVRKSPHFIFAPYVDPGTLEVLYKNAHLFMYPTLNEGFGYPPLEAMKYGTLCACSANSAVTEICADAVLYFNPNDNTEMGIRVLQSFNDTIRKEKIEKMQHRFKIIQERQKQDLDKLVNIILYYSDTEIL